MSNDMAISGDFPRTTPLDSYVAPQTNFVAVGDPPNTWITPSIGNRPAIYSDTVKAILDYEDSTAHDDFHLDRNKRASEMVDWLFKKLKEQYGA